MENYTFLSVIFYLISPDNIRYCRGLIVNMTSHKLTCLFNLSTRNQCDQLIMFFQKLWIAFLLLQIFYAEPVHLFPQVIQQRDQSLVIGCVYVILTGVDENGKQAHEFGSSEGNLKEKLYLNRAGTPGDDDYIVSFDVVLKPGMGQEREGVLAAHHACDEFIQIFREQMKKFRGDLCTERHEYHDVVRPGKKRVLIVKQVAGQGAMYDTSLFAKEPSGTENGRSIIDMGNMPVIVTPNEYRDGIIHSMQ